SFMDHPPPRHLPPARPIQLLELPLADVVLPQPDWNELSVGMQTVAAETAKIPNMNPTQQILAMNQNMLRLVAGFNQLQEQLVGGHNTMIEHQGAAVARLDTLAAGQDATAARLDTLAAGQDTTVACLDAIDARLNAIIVRQDILAAGQGVAVARLDNVVQRLDLVPMRAYNATAGPYELVQYPPGIVQTPAMPTTVEQALGGFTATQYLHAINDLIAAGAPGLMPVITNGSLQVKRQHFLSYMGFV
ncbi:unnamed protein product, partial [Mycena citricolor]